MAVHSIFYAWLEATRLTRCTPTLQRYFMLHIGKRHAFLDAGIVDGSSQQAGRLEAPCQGQHCRLAGLLQALRCGP